MLILYRLYACNCLLILKNNVAHFFLNVIIKNKLITKGLLCMKNLLFVSFALLCSILFVKNESFAFVIQDSTLTSSQVSSLNQVRAVGLQTVGTVVVWNQTGDPGDMYNDDGRPVWLECDGSSFDTGYYTTLASIIPGGVLPNLKDQFLRGGTSAQVGQVFTDTIRSHVHGQAAHSHTVSGNASSQM